MKVATALNPYQFGATVSIPPYELTDPPHVALAIDFTAALERDILDVLEEEKITDFALLPFWELMVALGKF